MLTLFTSYNNPARSRSTTFRTTERMTRLLPPSNTSRSIKIRLDVGSCAVFEKITHLAACERLAKQITIADIFFRFIYNYKIITAGTYLSMAGCTNI